MKLSSLLGNSQKLDGGSMYGNAPKQLWTRWSQPDERNRIDLACRVLLVETGRDKILFETGVGAYMEPALKDRFGVEETGHVLLNSLAALNLRHEDITQIVLSHLHFDHAGGLLSAWQVGRQPRLLFPNATYHVGSSALQRACQPHLRDRASFIPDLTHLLERSGRLSVLKADDVLSFHELEVRFFCSDGHTPGLMCAYLRMPKGRLVYASDLVPGRPWVHLAITTGFDRFPERVIEEKEELLSGMLDENCWVFYTHDHQVAASQVVYDPEKNRYSAGRQHAFFSRLESF